MSAPRSTLVGLTILAVLASAACILLGLWQGHRTLDILEAERAAASAPIDIGLAMTVDGYPGESIGRPVTAQGTYEGGQLLVDHRALDGREGLWVVTPMRVGDATVAVLRGWVPSAESPALAIPAGAVSVRGVLQPFEEFYQEAPVRADGLLVAISRSAIEQKWQTRTLPLVLVLQDQEPWSSPAPDPVPATVQTGNVPFPLQNAAYTLQWFGFAIFVWALWWMWVIRGPREDAARSQADSLSA